MVYISFFSQGPERGKVSWLSCILCPCCLLFTDATPVPANGSITLRPINRFRLLRGKAPEEPLFHPFHRQQVGQQHDDQDEKKETPASFEVERHFILPGSASGGILSEIVFFYFPVEGHAIHPQQAGCFCFVPGGLIQSFKNCVSIDGLGLIGRAVLSQARSSTSPA